MLPHDCYIGDREVYKMHKSCGILTAYMAWVWDSKEPRPRARLDTRSGYRVTADSASWASPAPRKPLFESVSVMLTEHGHIIIPSPRLPCSHPKLLAPALAS